MKSLFLAYLLCWGINFCFGQVQTVSILSSSEVNKIFSVESKKKFGITYNIYRVYRYADNGGTYLFAMTENIAKITAQKDTITDKIKGIFFKEVAGVLEKQLEMVDFTIKQAIANEQEKTMWFWSKYCLFEDLDKDGIIEPIIVYGTKGTNNYDDGRIKLLIFYKGKKIAIRHQNGVLDDERNTQIDATFYALPQKIQQQIIKIMQNISSNQNGIFPPAWEEGMKNKKTTLKE
jgi:hypothetical protein